MQKSEAESNNGLSVICIEDDRLIGEMYSRSLLRHGFSVDWVVDSQTAKDHLATKHYDVILLDIVLPIEMGTEILKFIKKDDSKNADSLVIVMTNFEQDTTSRLAMENQASAYIIKSETPPRDLLAIINRLTGRIGR